MEDLENSSIEYDSLPRGDLNVDRNRIYHNSSSKVRDIWSKFRIPIFLLAYYSSAIIFYNFFQKDFLVHSKTNGFTDGLYYSIVTFSTVGFGDITPNSGITKVFACVFVLLGVGIFSRWFFEEMDKMFGWFSIRFHSHRFTSSYRLKLVMRFGCLSVLMTIGVVGFLVFEDNNLIDSIYLSIMSASTVGYGDEHFDSQAGRLFSCLWILAAVWMVPKVLFYLGRDSNVEKDYQLALRKHDFFLKKLKEQGRINDAEINEINIEFEATDPSSEEGTVTPSSSASEDTVALSSSSGDANSLPSEHIEVSVAPSIALSTDVSPSTTVYSSSASHSLVLQATDVPDSTESREQ